MNIAISPVINNEWIDVCSTNDLADYSGICALISGQQVAIFYVPDAVPSVYALDNFCPSAKANVLARGIIGDIHGELVVASPIYKEHYRLKDGQCIEKDYSVNPWSIRVKDNRVLVKSN